MSKQESSPFSRKRTKKLLLPAFAAPGWLLGKQGAGPSRSQKSFASFLQKRRPFLLLFPILLASCGDLPRPFAGNPGRRALQLSAPPPPRLVIPPPQQGLLPAPDAAVWAHDVAEALIADEIPAFATVGGPGEWQLRLSATLRGDQVVPTYTLLDPKGANRGDVAGQPVPAAAWAQAAPAGFQKAASEVAPQVLGLLRAVDATIKQSDPNSLYNRPARIFFTGVTGAPGDGDAALSRFMRRKIPETGDQLVDHQASADFVLRGTVKMTDEPGGQQQVEIHWIVSDASGTIAGDVAQGHDIGKGTLDRFWGDVASVVADEAAGGVHEVITNFSGRRRALASGK